MAKKLTEEQQRQSLERQSADRQKEKELRERFWQATQAGDLARVESLTQAYPEVKPTGKATWLEETAYVALQKAHLARDLTLVRELLKRFPGLQTSTSAGNSWLTLAIRSGSLPLVEFWLKKQPDADLSMSLLDATTDEMTRFLLGRGADPNAWCSLGTPLHSSTSSEQIGTLLAAGADPSITDDQRRTPLAVMKSLGRQKCVEALLNAGAPLEGQLPRSETKRKARLISGTVIVDISEDISDFLVYVRRRVKQHLSLSRKRKNPELVRMIDFGFEYGQQNWVVLTFDTRKDAEPDGEWSRNISKILLRRPKWPKWPKLADDAHVYFINLAGKKIDVMPSPDELICKIVGDALKHVLMVAREQGVFDPLPKAKRCELGVENLEGFYGWPKCEDRGKENLL